VRITLTLSAILLLGACGGTNEESSAAHVGDVEVEGEPIPVQSDPRATYQLVSWSEMPAGHREALTRRDGSSGTSYARREIDCAGKRFRYLGEGDTRQEAEAKMQDGGKMAALVPGSISSEVSEFVCTK
jgi:hypothetical protein